VTRLVVTAVSMCIESNIFRELYVVCRCILSGQNVVVVLRLYMQ